MADDLRLDVTINAEVERFERAMRDAGRLVEGAASGMDKATKRAAKSFELLESRIDPAARAARLYERDMRRVQDAVDKGAISQERAASVARKLGNQYEATVSRINGMTQAQRHAQQAAQAQAEVAERAAQAEYNRALGVDQSAKSARASAAVFEQYEEAQREATRATEEAARAEAKRLKDLDDLRARYNPLYAAQRAYKAELGDLKRALAAGAISQKEYADALARTKAAFAGQVNAINGVESAVDRASATVSESTARYRQFGNIAQQAGYQIGDFATQVAGGQSWVLALTQQGTQLISMFGPWGAVVGAAGAVVGALAVNLLDTDEASKDAKTSADAYKSALEQLEEQQKRTTELEAKLAGTYRSSADEALKAAQKKARAALEELKAREDALTATVEKLANASFGERGQGQLSAAQASLRALVDERKEAEAELAKIEKQRADAEEDRKKAIAQTIALEGKYLEQEKALQQQLSEGTIKSVLEYEARISALRRAQEDAIPIGSELHQQLIDLELAKANVAAATDDLTEANKAAKTAQEALNEAMGDGNDAVDKFAELVADRQKHLRDQYKSTTQLAVEELERQKKAWLAAGGDIAEANVVFADKLREIYAGTANEQVRIANEGAAGVVGSYDAIVTGAQAAGAGVVEAFAEATRKSASLVDDAADKISASMSKSKTFRSYGNAKDLRIKWNGDVVDTKTGMYLGKSVDLPEELMNAVSGRRQYGGPVMAGKPYLVGEAGPEIMVPSVSGRIIPNHKISNLTSNTASMTQSVTVNVSGAGDPNAVADAVVARINSAARQGRGMIEPGAIGSRNGWTAR